MIAWNGLQLLSANSERIIPAFATPDFHFCADKEPIGDILTELAGSKKPRRPISLQKILTEEAVKDKTELTVKQSVS